MKKTMLLFAVLACAMTLAGCERATANRLFKEGQAAELRGDWETAAGKYSEAGVAGKGEAYRKLAELLLKGEATPLMAQEVKGAGWRETAKLTANRIAEVGREAATRGFPVEGLDEWLTRIETAVEESQAAEDAERAARQAERERQEEEARQEKLRREQLQRKGVLEAEIRQLEGSIRYTKAQIKDYARELENLEGKMQLELADLQNKVMEDALQNMYGYGRDESYYQRMGVEFGAKWKEKKDRLESPKKRLEEELEVMQNRLMELQKQLDEIPLARAEREEKLKQIMEKARDAATRKAWDDVLAFVEKALMIESGNAEALRLKKSAEDALKPRIRLTATLNGREVPATVLKGLSTNDKKTPVTVMVTRQGNYGFALEYKADGKRYTGKTVVLPNPRGMTEVTVSLEEWIKPGTQRTITLPGGEKMEMVWCPPGSFMMGSNNQRSEERPVHKVTLTKGFWMSKTEVTQKQWQSVMGNNPSYFKGDNLPVEQVNWKDVQEFCRKAGNDLRLPTEAEWEYACRAGGTGDYGKTKEGRDGKLDDMGWHSGLQTQPVGQKQPNAWGLYDMHGNVFEWCQDWAAPYPRGAVTDPKGDYWNGNRICRGGAILGTPDKNSLNIWSSAFRGGYSPSEQVLVIGFRPCCFVLSESNPAKPTKRGELARRIRQEAEQGISTSQFLLGGMYETGNGVPQNDATAAMWYRKAAEQGHADAQSMLGLRYLSGKGVNQDNKEAAKWLQKAAEQGDAGSQIILGKMYENGDGVPKDEAKAAMWYRKAADKGEAQAQFSLGMAQLLGRGVEKNPKEAAGWMQKAAEQGEDHAQYVLWLLYSNGNGVSKDEAKAKAWLRKAADRGNADAQLELGNICFTGIGGEQDFTEAAKWFQKAAEQGNADAQLILGVMYKKGTGVQANDTTAEMWLRKAAAQGKTQAQEWLK